MCLAAWAIPSTARAQCDWGQASLFADGYYSESSDAWAVYAEGYDWVAGCCYHTYMLEIQAATQVSTHYVTTESLTGEMWRSNDEPGPVNYTVNFWVNCHCVSATVAFVQRQGQIPTPPPPAACAIPVNFHQTGAQDAGGGVLQFSYAWDSSTGNHAHLSSCEVGERVDYPQTPWPAPFPPNNPPNPTEISVNAQDGGFVDTHSTGSGSAFQKPYFATTFSATQIYRYRCACANSGQWVTVMGPHNIDRKVDYVLPLNEWWFSIEKTGSFAYMQLP